MNWHKRLTEARERKGLKKSHFAKLVGVSPPTVTQWETGTTEKIAGENLIKVCSVLEITGEWLLNGGSPIARAEGQRRRLGDFDLVSADETDEEVGEIEYWNARGSCGGGFLNYDQLPKGTLIKEIAFFKKYNLRPQDAFAIYADGDSMSDFIVDGDLVIFDKSKTEPKSGAIFAVDHPDGLRIKKLRRVMDGSWILESNNVDKSHFPDEAISPSDGELLKVLGRFVYRQGG